ncbi:MAG: ABC transporter permease [Bacteroidales bacterium]|nr:ABC transporter permease [Lentimicrobiaceae bacterium]MDD5696124.1 ABC transporter permease [Bacteroidales bacterium]
MRTIYYLIRKEFLQIFRDKFIGKAIFGIPIVQMLILVPAITFEIRHIDLCIVDRDLSTESRGLVSQLEGSTFFKIRFATFSEQEANDLLSRDQCDLILQIPAGFGKEIGRGSPVKIFVTANAINASNAQLSWAYLSGVIGDYNQNILAENTAGRAFVPVPQIRVTNRYWYNELLNYKFYMLPGILGILVLAIGFLLAGLNLVKEKESGTIEQINVTPVKKYHFIIAKMVPFLVIGLIDLALGLTLGKLIFHVPFEGNIALLFLCSAIFLVAVLGFALFLSTFSGTQQQFMFTAFFFMIIFILMSGVFTPLESMPLWAQRINLVNPVVYVMRINRMVLLKGSTFHDISREILALTLIAIAFTALAINRYRKRA